VLAPLNLFAPRVKGQGPQALPVNRTAAQAEVSERALDPAWSLDVRSAGDGRRTYGREELSRMPQAEAVLPIACVEGWSASARWGGVPVGALLDVAGVDPDQEVEIDVESLERDGLYGRSILTNDQARAHDTLLALTIGDEDLDIDHGYPCRLIAGNRPGVLQTKWVERLVVRS
jgi:DMSO/TMAO reductase YedYZ molybdopterin-dependent catalytic subunit